MTPETRRAVLWSGAEAACSGLFSFVSVCMVARLVGPSELGLGAAAVAVHVLLWVAVNALFADALVQRGATDDSTVSSALWASIGAGGLAALLQAGLGWPLAAWLGDKRLWPMSVLLALPLPLVGAGGVMQGVLTIRRRYRILAWRTLAGQGLGTIAGIMAAYAHAGAWAPVLQQFVISTAGAAALLTGAHVRPRAELRLTVLRSLLRVGMPLTASTLVLAGRYRLFAVLIGGTAGAATLGEVHMAFRLVETVRELAFTALWRLMLPILSERQHDQAALRAACDRLLRWTSLALLPLCGALALLLPVLIRVVLGPGWVPSGLASEPLLALMALLTLAFPSSIAVVANGDTTRSLIGSLLSTGAVLGGAVLLRPADPLSATLLWLGAHLLALPYVLRVNAGTLGTGLLRPLRAGWPMFWLVALGVTLGLLVPLAGRGFGAWLWCAAERLALLAAIVLPAVAAHAVGRRGLLEAGGRTWMTGLRRS